MKKMLFLIWVLIVATTLVKAQQNKSVTVYAGEKVQDRIPFSERYHFGQFTESMIYYNNGAYSKPRVNYNLLTAEMEYIEAKDTLAIANPELIMLIVAGGDTFFYDHAYLEIILSGTVRVAVKQYFELKEVLKKDSYGSAPSNAATDSYSSIETRSKTYKLVTNYDRVFEKLEKYYLSVNESSFVIFNRKKVLELFQGNKDDIKEYISTRKTDFNSRADLLELAGFLGHLKK